MQELNQQELLSKVNQVNEKPFAVFMYTPLCGTCKVTERMLNIILAMKPKLPLVKCNINFLPQVSQEWRIASVPCVVIIEQGKEKEMIYRMQSVDELYRRLMPLIEQE
ncbi:thioredoxin family protein [Paenibacillus qinlingensis]|uniref:Thioredoxin-like negative regulator of GroEL n=1 Tax=Paenibacillus qinlingensis TaxID=1837343 RepID=A0ABU1NRQ5_9BACL|nr:thioredoxin family protein [Paenibacillus qinlingensis]MDR6549707.1 thioredoxin-like negative regulator of GroEL [Paenibacillus qinlingensis]